jgi:hypothetical protein
VRPAAVLAAALGLAAGLAIGRPAHGADTVVQATLEPAVIGVGEVAVFTIEVRGTGLRSLSFRPDFELENLDIVGGPNQFDDMRFGNGTLTRTFRESWQVRARAAGKARVHSLRVRLDDELIQMRDREITVQEEPTRQADVGARDETEADDPFERLLGGGFFQRRPPPSRQPAVFLRADVQPQHPYVGQQVLYTVSLYTRDDITSMAAREMPTFRGFWVRDVPQPQHLPTDMVVVDGLRYARVAVVQKALFPLRPGRYTIEPAAMDVIARIVESRLFAPPFAHPEQIVVKTPPVALEVQPLPAAPAGFAGAVGQMQLTARVEPTRLRLGEAATLTVTLAGRGNVQGVGEPRVPPPPGLKIFPPQQQGEENVVGTSVQGTRTWSWVIVPERTGRAALRVPEIPYFDPQSAEYKTASAPPVEITILPPVNAANAVDKTADTGDTGDTGILRSIRNAAAGQDRTAFFRPRTALWLIVLPLSIVLLFAVARRRQSLAASAGNAVNPTSAAAAPPALDAAERLLLAATAESRPRQAAARIEEAWRGFLAERWEIPAGTPPARWGALLRDRGADPQAAEDLVRLADDLHYLRNAPQLSAVESLSAEALSSSRRLLRRLR